ncbi:MAG: PAS domain S-box protein, partial [Desulfovibrionaceae bacterium]
MLAVVLWAAFLACPAARAQSSSRVLVLHSYRQGQAWTDRIQGGIAAVFARSARSLDVDVEYLDALRLESAQARLVDHENFYSYIRQKSAGLRYGVVIVSDDEALDLLLDHREVLAAGAPVVFCGVDGRAPGAGIPPGVASVALVPAYGETLALALRLDPQVRRVLFLGDTSPRGTAARAQLEAQVGGLGEQPAVYVLQEPDIGVLERRLASLGPDWVVILAGRPREDGRLLSDAETAARLSRASTVPVYAVRDTSLGQGVLGGEVVVARTQGEAAARTALRILDGEDPQAAARAEQVAVAPKVDHDPLHRFGLDATLLPSDAVVLNVPRFIRFMDTWLFAAYGTVLVVLLLLVAVLVRSVLRRRRVERELLENRAKYALAIGGAKVGPWEFDLSTRIFTFNDVFYALYATTAEREGGYEMSAERYALEFLPPDQAELVNRAIVRQLVAEPEDEIHVIEHEMVRRDGERRHITVNYRILFDKDGRPVRTLGANVDVTDTRKAVEQLRASEQMFRVLVKSAPVGILLEDREGRVVTCNEAAANVFGMTAAEVLEKGYDPGALEVVSQDGAVLPQDDYPSRFTLRTGLPQRGVVLGVRAGDEVIWMRVDTAPIPDPVGGRPAAVVVVLEDITKRRQDESALMESAERFRSIFDFSPTGLCLLDGEGRILDANHALAEIFQLRPDEIIGLTPLERMPDSPLRRSLEDALAQGLGAYEGPFTASIGGRRRFIKTAWRRIGPGLYLGTVEDVTAAKLAEQAVAESLRRFKFLLDGVSHIAVQGYDEERRVIFWNQASATLYGYTEAEALGRRLEDLIIPGPMREGVVQGVTAWVEQGEAIPAGELVLCDKQGRDVPVYSSHVMYEGPEGAKEMFCIDMDLAELRRTQEALRRSEAITGAMFERSPLGMLLLDASGKVRDCNQAICDLLGYVRHHCLGLDLP